MIGKFDEAALDVLSASRHECLRSRSSSVSSEHLLLALTRDPMNVAARALASMNIKSENVQNEVDRALLAGGKTDAEPPSMMPSFESIVYDEEVKAAIARANEIRLFFGRQLAAPEHLLLALIDLKDEATIKILDELGVNLIFLRRQVLNFAAKEDSLRAHTPGVRNVVINGLNELINNHLDSVENLKRLGTASNTNRASWPEKNEIALMSFLYYLPDFLLNQVALQRYILEETLRMLNQRVGAVDKETTATIVSNGAQNMRAEVRGTIEYLWSNELRMLGQMPDEAEHDVIGSVIEDLWWTHSEEIALHEVFDEAMDDYRRKHVLNLQKRRIELTQRLTKLRSRLDDTIKQCFLKRSPA